MNSDREIYERVRNSGKEVLLPVARERPYNRVNRDLIKAAASEGIFQLLFPADGEVSATTVCLIREALGYACLEADAAVTIQGMAGYTILQSGTSEQVQRWREPLRRGEVVAGFALTEPNVGSDAAALELEARVRPGGWTLHGEKMWITNAPDADFYVTFARTSSKPRAKGVTAFLVPADRSGLGGESIEMLAEHPIGRLTFDGVEVGPEDILGELDAGFRVAMRAFDLFRSSVAASAVGLAEAALATAAARTQRRSVFGAPLSERQVVRHALADVATRIEASRALVDIATRAHEKGDSRVTARAAMAKVFATETAQQAVDVAVQFHGASGLQAGHSIERLYREVRATRIFEGASEVQRDLIARDLYAWLTQTPDLEEPSPALVEARH